MTPQIEQALRIAGKWHPAGTPGHVLIAGFDGDDNGYAAARRRLLRCRRRAESRLRSRADLAARSIEMWAGERPPKTAGRSWLRDHSRHAGTQSASGCGATAHGRRSSGIAAGAASRRERPELAPVQAVRRHDSPSSSAPAVARGARMGAVHRRTAGLRSARCSPAATLHDVLLAMLPLAILVAGQMLVLLIGQIDLSMTAVMATGSVVSASVMTRHAADVGEPATTLAGDRRVSRGGRGDRAVQRCLYVRCCACLRSSSHWR